MENDTDIDYKALYEGVSRELEAARIAIMKLRYARSPLDKLTGDRLTADNVRAFVTKNYFLIIIALYIISMAPSFIRLAGPLLAKRRNIRGLEK